MVVDEAVEAQTVLDSVRARRRARAARRCGCSTSTAASRSARASKSLALRLEFRSPERTLTDEEVAGIRERIKDGAGWRARAPAGQPRVQ